MAIAKVIPSKSSHNLVHYILDGKAHNKTFTTERNLYVGGHNIFTDYQNKFNSNYIDSQFYAVRKLADKTDKKTQAFHNIYSFSEEDFPSTTDKKELKKQAKQAYKLVSSFLKEQLPNDSQYIIGIQKDGEGGKLHAHVAINSVLINGKVLDTNDLSLIQKITTKQKNKVITKTKHKGLFERMQDFMYKHFPAVTGRNYTKIERQTENLVNSKAVPMDNRNAYIWKEDLKQRIIDCAQHSANLDEFKQNLHDAYGVDVKEYQSSTGKLDANGKKIKRLAYTYSFKDDDGKQHKSRDFHITKQGATRGLGKFTRPSDLQDFMEKQQQLEQQQEAQELAELQQKQSSLDLKKVDVINDDNTQEPVRVNRTRTQEANEYSSTPEYNGSIKSVKQIDVKQSKKLDSSDYEQHTRELEQQNLREVARRQQQADADAQRQQREREQERRKREQKRKQLEEKRRKQQLDAERRKKSSIDTSKQADADAEQPDDVEQQPTNDEPDIDEFS